MPLPEHFHDEADSCSAFGNEFESAAFYLANPLRIFPNANRSVPCARDPPLALAADRSLHPLTLRVRFLVRTDHYQQAVYEIHWLRLEAFPVVLAAVAGCHDRDACVHYLRELRLRLQWLGPAQAIQSFNDQYRACRHLTVLNSAQEHAERTLPYVPLVIGGEPLVPK